MRSKTPSFTIELELITTPSDRRFLEARKRTAVSIYNSCLNEALKRMHKLRHDRTYQDAAQKYGKLKEKNPHDPKLKDLAKTMHGLALSYGFTEYDMHSYVNGPKRHFHTLGIDECQTLASRAYKAASGILYGDAEKVSFASSNADFTIEGKSKNSSIKLKPDLSVRFGKDHRFQTKPVRNAAKKAYLDEALTHRVKYCRLVSRTIRGRRRWFIQPVLEGTPPAKHRTHGPHTPVGLDIGVSTLAVSSGNTAMLTELAPHAEPDAKKIRKIRRAMDRSRRSTNPENYNADGTVKKGVCHWKQSSHYRRLKNHLKDMYRKDASLRRQSHEILANEVLSLGTDVRVETMQIKGLSKRSRKTRKNRHGKTVSKKRYGKTVAIRAPAMLISIIDRKLRYAEFKLQKLDTIKLKASQYDHVSGAYHKKQLKDRITTVGNTTVQRDMYSAFLCEHADMDTSVIDRKGCFRDFPVFSSACADEIQRIRNTGNKHMLWYVT